MRSIKTAAAIFLGMVLLACGSHEKPGLTGCGAPGAQAGGETTVAQALAELDALPVPAGVDDELFQALKDAFGEALADTGVSSGGKFISKPPDGDTNKVTDLHFRPDGDDYYLAWGYRNVGDYNQDSTVNIADITPLAAHFNENVIDHPEADPIDGNGDTVVDIKDITPLAASFTVQCSKYAIEGAAGPSGPWEPVEVVPLSEASEPPGRRQFDHLMATIGYAYFRVVPMDDGDNPGIASDPAAAPVSRPVISGVSPTEVPAGTQRTFTATVSGSEPFTYEWTFGDAATVVPPSTLADAEPVMQITDTVDTYGCSVTVSNDFGEDTFGFDLVVVPPAFTVSGTVTETGTTDGIPDVALTLSPGGYEDLTGADGTYSVTDVPDGDYTLTPSKTDYVFDPTTRDVTVAGDDVTGQDFSGEIPPKYTVSGTVTFEMAGLQGVTLSLGGGLSDTTDSSGYFAITDVPPGDYVLTPSMFGYIFTPPSRNVEVVDADVTGQNFVAEETSGNWSYNTIDSTNGLYNHISLMVAGGKPAVAYSWEGDGTPDDAAKFARSPSADGSGSWTLKTVAEDSSPTEKAGYCLAGALVGGHPAIVYDRNVSLASDHLMYTYNSAADGSGSWNGPNEIDSSPITIARVSMAEVGGLPVICYHDATAGSSGLLFASNNSADGTGSWTKNTVESGTAVGFYNSITDVGGKPAIGYYYMGGGQTAAKFAMNTNANGSGTWNRYLADSDNGSGVFISIAEVVGKPAVAYQKAKALYVSIAPNSAGSGTWAVRLVDDTDQAGAATSLGIIGGYPGVAYYVGSPDLDLKFAINSAPDGAGSWGKSVADSTGQVGQNCSMVDIGGKPAVAYWDYTNKTLKFAIMQ